MTNLHQLQLARTLRPLEVVAYLRSRGWQETKSFPGRGSAWGLRLPSGEQAEVLVPVSHEIPDACPRLFEVLRTLELVEGRAFFEVWRDLSTARSDLLRVRVTLADAKDGSLPVEAVVGLVQGVRDLLLAAACAAVDPRPVYATRKPAQALQFLEQTRFGQTEHGSFTLTVESPVPPSLGGAAADAEEPFGRRAFSTLLTALQEATSAAGRATAQQSTEPFREAVRRGVSANLCEATASLARLADPVEGLPVSVSWAAVRPGPSAVPTRVVLPVEAGPIFAEAARYFRATSPQPDVELRGLVVRLERAEGSQEGSATLLALVDGQPRKVEVRLGADDYGKAVKAHGGQLSVTCQGELTRRGNLFRLENARQFSVDE